MTQESLSMMKRLKTWISGGTGMDDLHDHHFLRSCWVSKTGWFRESGFRDDEEDGLVSW